ncbi:unnamed protein product [Rotaria sp. Silwood2]|nr:unnamed protein product [Rotaria sp. Silwood2]CAF3022971.1 unnamed protein product [Rotaria sp. Silwood2]CAF3173742.1 unnamed protein product [Rotaria sp. Silwood2]CAF4199597.1 unnamed protein product [Rotaria sp. Silwood2]CAF4331611.1 unnamed protein product [Rotaria sp. Silwood2]
MSGIGKSLANVSGDDVCWTDDGDKREEWCKIKSGGDGVVGNKSNDGYDEVCGGRGNDDVDVDERLETVDGGSQDDG